MAAVTREDVSQSICTVGEVEVKPGGDVGGESDLETLRGQRQGLH